MASSDRALRVLVSELALAPADDVEEILQRLGPARQLRVRTLLGEYRGADAVVETIKPAPAQDPVTASAAEASAPALQYDFDGLSPGLARRLRMAVCEDDPAAAPEGEADKTVVWITPRTQSALREIAVSRQRTAPVEHAAAPARKLSWDALKVALFQRVERRA